ncbi:MAG TPA: diguanylate cyclase [Polyangiaceae bacterium]|jgi:diguanylate cyclase (GGDEF)-like protein
MPDDGRSPGSPSNRGAPLRTKPFDDDSNSLREALQRELRKSVSPALVVILGPDVGTRVVLDRSVDMGRDPSCELPLRDENVSWRHARVEDQGNGDWALVDLGSTNGTVLDGQPCKGAPIVPGNRIFLGKTVIEMQQDALRDAHAAELERLISVDELSGLWVKRRFDAQLAASFAAVAAGSSPALSVVVMDMDGVKGINDTHGHHMGAFVIGEAGHVIGKGIEGRGFATRFGGDEFAAGLPGVGKEEAVAVAEALRAAVVAHVYEKDGVRVHPGLSCGVACAPVDGHDAPEALFQAADQAMYRAKRAGKNRVST